MASSLDTKEFLEACEGRSCSQVARLMGIRASTAHQRIRRLQSLGYEIGVVPERGGRDVSDERFAELSWEAVSLRDLADMAGMAYTAACQRSLRLRRKGMNVRRFS